VLPVPFFVEDAVLLSEITWSRQNKDSERSQVLYRGQDVYLLMRTPQPGESAKPQPTNYLYTLYRDGNTIENRCTDPSALLKNLLPHKMTPLEYKCWQLEQKQ
jgi:hypothetical protein